MERDSWKRLIEAQEFYESKGFRYFDADWLVTPETSAITKPAFVKDFYIKDKVLVGSAEQSFLEAYNRLDDGLYYAITPCFRNERRLDELHQQYFMKLELFSKDQDQYIFIKKSAWQFFKQYFSKEDIENFELEFAIRRVGSDLIYKDIELGSYMPRDYKNMKWVCGTGLAEPRLTNALKRSIM